MAEPELEFVKATREHAELLAPVMRKEDAAEIKASGDYAPFEGIMASIDASDEAWAAFMGDEIACIFGVVQHPKDPAVGIPWLLTSNNIEKYPKKFFIASKYWLLRFQRQYPKLVQMVDARYSRALKWANRCGFAIHVPKTWGVEDRDFHPITMEVKSGGITYV